LRLTRWPWVASRNKADQILPVDQHHDREILGADLGDTGSTGFTRSTIARRSARLICRASCQKIIFDLQLADLPIQKVNLRLTGRPLRSRVAVLENTRRAVQQLLLPIVDLVRMHPELARHSATVRSPRTAASATFALNAVLCFLRVPFMSCSRPIGAF